MIEHSKLIAVHDSMKDFLKKKDFSHPYIIYATNLDREEGIDYVIDTLMCNREGRYVSSKPLRELTNEVKRAKTEGYKYYVKKIYSFEKLGESDLNALNQELCGNTLPAILIICAGILPTYEDKMPDTISLY